MKNKEKAIVPGTQEAQKREWCTQQGQSHARTWVPFRLYPKINGSH